jgi:DNA-binding CsgD family transcriptional regulator
MAVIDERDVGLLSEAILQLREAPSVDEFPALALEVTTSLVRNDLAGWNDVDPVHDRAVAIVHPHREVTAQVDLMAELMHEHPLITYTAETGDGSAMMISDFLTSDEWHRRRIYRDVFRHIGMEHQIAVGVPAVLPRLTAIALNRNEPGDDFVERDRVVLNLLRPHLAQALEQVRERERLGRMVGTITGALGDTGAHVIALDPQPSDVTPGALVLLYRYFGRPGAHDPFPARLSRWLEAQRRVAHAAAGDDLPVPLVPIAVTRDGRRLVVRYLAGTPTTQEALLLDERSSPVQAGELERLGLTRREAEVLQLLGTGATNAALAEQLHVSPATVKTHLENIYRKLGAQSRAQAVAMALTLLPGEPEGAEIGRSAD